MFKIRSVALLTIATLVTGVVEYVGLHRLEQLWGGRVAAAPCPAPVAVAAEREAIVPLERPEIRPEIGWISVRPDGVELDVDGHRLALPGYPAPRQESDSASITTVVFAPDRAQIAIAGDCSSGNSAQPPTCARTFVRLYRIADGAHVRDFKTLWQISEQQHRVRAMAFDERGERLAVLLQASWADCMWEGDAPRLVVYRISDGKRLLHRVLARDDTGEANTNLSFGNDEVRVTTWPAGGHPKRQVVRLRKPKAA